jgi:exonuclease III
LQIKWDYKKCGNFNSFLIGLDNIIKSLYKVKLNLIICGDINTDNERKKTARCCVTVLKFNSYNAFPPRVQNQSNTVMDIKFIDNYKFTEYNVSPIYNGLSDNEAQFLTTKDINLKTVNRPS